MTRFFNFCPNPRCDNHRGLAGWQDTAMSSEGPRRCPLCGQEIVHQAYDEMSFDTEPLVVRGRVPTSSEATTGVVLDPVPYHGFWMKFGDDDDARRYEGTAHTDDRGGHIAELKRDLLMLGYYSAVRGHPDRGAAGQFHLQLLGAVLAFKYDLIHEYGVSAAQDATRPTDIETLSIDTAGPIQYDRNLRSPYQPDFAPFHKRIVDDGHSSTIGETLTTVRNQWDRATGARGWRTTTETARTAPPRRGATGPYLQPAIPRGHLRTLAAANTNAGNLVNTPGFSAVPGEPADPQIGAPLTETDLEWFQPFEQALAPLVTLVDEVWASIQAWDTGTEGQAGTLRAEITRLTATEGTRPRTISDLQDRLTSWETYRDGWRDLRLKTRTLVGRARAFVRRNLDAFVAYRRNLIKYGTVDTATAIHIKHILLHRRLPARGGERAVFVCPQGDEVEQLAEGQTLADMIRDLATQHNIPFPIIVRQIQHESGSSQTSRVGRLTVPTFGVDWNNSGRRHMFNEMYTKPDPWRWSCGWGATQFTSFSDDIDGMPHRAGIPLSRDTTPPVPPYIRTLRGNLEMGVRLMRRKFDHSTVHSPPRDCTFATRFECTQCLRPSRFGLTQPSEVTALLRAVDTGGHPADGDQAGYYFDLPPDRLRTIFGYTGGDTIEEKIEWPCSWLTAKMRYGGTGEQAWGAFTAAVSVLSRDGAAEEAGASGGTVPAAAEDEDAAGEDDD